MDATGTIISLQLTILTHCKTGAPLTWLRKHGTVSSLCVISIFSLLVCTFLLTTFFSIQVRLRLNEAPVQLSLVCVEDIETRAWKISLEVRNLHGVTAVKYDSGAQPAAIRDYTFTSAAQRLESYLLLK